MSHISHDPPAPWWKTAVIYQIYPRSFGDSSGDGVGDLAGITERLDHLAWLGVDAIWLSPFFRSPMHDFGYDVSDYCDVDPVFGTLADFDRAARGRPRARTPRADRLGARPHLDRPPLVRGGARVAHQPQRDWYVWRDAGPAGGLPNNWPSAFTQGARPGPSTRRPASTTCTASCPSSPTSTGRTRTCVRPCTTRCASGSTAAWTGSAPT